MTARTLNRYFFRHQMLSMVQFFLGVFVIAYLGDFTEFARRAGGSGSYSLASAMFLSLLKMPSLIVTVVPFVVLFASMGTLMSLNRRLELVVARSAGVSAWQFLTPLCAASLLVGLVTILVVNPISAYSFSKAEELEAQLRGIERSDSSTSRIPWMRQNTDEGVTIIGAADTARRGLLLTQPVFIRLAQDGSIASRVDARQAILEDGNWKLDDAVIIGKDRQREKLKHFEIKSGLPPEVVEQRLARPDSIPIYELGSKIKLARALGMQANAFAMKFHSLIALPALLVAMTLIAATVSMRFARMGQSAALILGGIVAGFLLYVVTVVVTAFGSAGIVPPVVAAWLPVVVSMFIGVAFLLFKEDG